MGNYDVNAWCVSNAEATVSISGIKDMCMLLMGIRLNILRLYREISFSGRHFEISDHAVGSISAAPLGRVSDPGFERGLISPGTAGNRT